MFKESERYQGARYEQIFHDQQQEKLIIAFFGLYFEISGKLNSLDSKETKKIKYSAIVTVKYVIPCLKFFTVFPSSCWPLTHYRLFKNTAYFSICFIFVFKPIFLFSSWYHFISNSWPSCLCYSPLLPVHKKAYRAHISSFWLMKLSMCVYQRSETSHQSFWTVFWT